jgi:hypothetical protein
VRRWQAAQIQGGFQGARPADHREFPSSQSERRAVERGSRNIIGKTMAGGAVRSIANVSARTDWPLPETMIRPSTTKIHSTSALWDTAQVVGTGERLWISFAGNREKLCGPGSVKPLRLTRA